MEVILGKKAGFCPGVTNTVTKVEKQLEIYNPLYCLGEIIHNPIVVDRLKEKGLKIVQTIEEVPEGQAMVIRAHGATKQVYSKAEQKGLTLIDLTCPKVLEIHKQAENYAKQGYYILLIGEKEHVETIGTFSCCGQYATMIEEKEDIFSALEKIKETNIRNVAILAQTTFLITKFDNFVETIKRHIDKDTNLEVNKTICDATRLRQAETREIAKQVEVMVVIGSHNSSNSKKLYDISIEECNNALLVEKLDDLYVNYIRRFHKVGVTAGASTPDDMIETVVKILKETETEGCIYEISK